MSGNGRDYIDPSLLSLIDKAKEDKSISVGSLKKSDVLEVHTRNSIYTLKIIDPEALTAEVTGNGSWFRTPTVVSVDGTSLTGTGTMISLGRVIIGYRLLLGGEVLLSTTQRLVLNGVEIK